jgi:hypothetical protein
MPLVVGQPFFRVPDTLFSDKESPLLLMNSSQPAQPQGTCAITVYWMLIEIKMIDFAIAFSINGTKEA